MIQNTLNREQSRQLLKALALEAGWRHLAWLSGLSSLNSLLDIAGLGQAVTLPLGGDHHQNEIKTWLQ